MSGNVILILVTILACIAIVLGVKAWNLCNEVDKERVKLPMKLKLRGF